MPHLTPLQAIRKYCVNDCCAGSAHEVRLCPSHACEFYKCRFNKKPPGVGSTLKIIRAKCIDCSTGNMAEVKRCWDTDCVLYEYRMGHNPRRKGLGRPGGNPHIAKVSRENPNPQPNSEPNSS